MEDDLRKQFDDLLKKAKQKGDEMAISQLTETSKMLFPDIDPNFYLDEITGRYKSDILTQQQLNQVGELLPKKKP